MHGQPIATVIQVAEQLLDRLQPGDSETPTSGDRIAVVAFALDVLMLMYYTAPQSAVNENCSRNIFN